MVLSILMYLYLMMEKFISMRLILGLVEVILMPMDVELIS